MDLLYRQEMLILLSLENAAFNKDTGGMRSASPRDAARTRIDGEPDASLISFVVQPGLAVSRQELSPKCVFKADHDRQSVSIGKLTKRWRHLPAYRPHPNTQWQYGQPKGGITQPRPELGELINHVKVGLGKLNAPYDFCFGMLRKEMAT